MSDQWRILRDGVDVTAELQPGLDKAFRKAERWSMCGATDPDHSDAYCVLPPTAHTEHVFGEAWDMLIPAQR